MGLRQSKKIKALSKKCRLLLYTAIYPRIILNAQQYKTYRAAYSYFEENYKNIIALDSHFFVQNLKKHIAWIQSSEFQGRYGAVEDLGTLHSMAQTIGAMQEHYDKNTPTSTIVTPPPRYIQHATHQRLHKSIHQHKSHLHK